MALAIRILCKNSNLLNILTNPVKWKIGGNYPLRIIASNAYSPQIYIRGPFTKLKHVEFTSITTRSWSNRIDEKAGKCYPVENQPVQEPAPKPGLVQRFKEMYKSYWYVLLPVHVTCSVVWFGCFYYAVRCGLDVVSILESFGVSEKLMAPLRESSAGYYALAFALYKLVTPLRYAVTVGTTTFAIKRLTAIGWIKPVPSAGQIKEMLQVKKDNLQDRFNESKVHYNTKLKAKQTQVMGEMKRYKEEIKNMKSKAKK